MGHRTKSLITVISIVILIGAIFTGMVQGKKPEGSPCYVLDDSFELGNYSGDLRMDILGDYLLVYSGERVYYTSDLYTFGSTTHGYEEKSDDYVRFTGSGVEIGGRVGKVFTSYLYFSYDYPYAAVLLDSGVWVYDVLTGDYVHLAVNATKVQVSGGEIYVLRGNNVLRYLADGTYIGVFLRDVGDFAVLKDPAGYIHYAYESRGVVWYRDTVPNIYDLVDDAPYLNGSERNSLIYYFDNDNYSEAMDYLNGLNVSMEYGWHVHLLESRIRYTEIDPKLPEYGDHNPKPSIVYTFPAYRLNGNMVVTFKAKGLGKVKTMGYDPVFHIRKLIVGHVHMKVYINNYLAADITRDAWADDAYRSYTITLKAQYIKHSRSQLNNLMVKFSVVAQGKEYSYNDGHVKFVSLKMNGQDVFRDSDGDGLGLAWEYYYGTNPTRKDTDGDGLSDGQEVNGWSIKVNGKWKKVTSNPMKKDTDGDGVEDWVEKDVKSDPRKGDTDGDGMPDKWEYQFNLKISQGDAGEDVDGDGLSNLEEYRIHTNPRNADSDYDGIPDGWEARHGLNPRVYDSTQDKDGDGLSNIEEYRAGTEPLIKDTDGDGLSDYVEVKVSYTVWWYDSSGRYHSRQMNSDPLLADSDGDGLSDKVERNRHLNPRSSDTDGDGLSDLDEVRGWYVFSEGIHVSSSPNAYDTDRDGLSDLREFENDTDPRRADTDGDHMVDSADPIPTIEEDEAPSIAIPKVYTDQGKWVLRGIHAEDNVGVERIDVYYYVGGSEVTHHYWVYNGKRSVWLNTSISRDAWDFVKGNEIEIVVTDVNGNRVYYNYSYSLYTVISDAWNKIKNFVAGNLVQAVKALIAAYPEAAPLIAFSWGFGESYWSNGIGGLIDMLTNMGDILSGLQKLLDEIKKNGLVNVLSEMASAMLEEIDAKVKELVSYIRDPEKREELFDPSKYSYILGKISCFLITMVVGQGFLFSGLNGFVKNLMGDAGKLAETFGKLADTIKRMKSIVEDAKAAALAKVVEKSKAVKEAVKELIQSGRMSEKAEELMNRMARWFGKEGVEREENLVKEAAEEIENGANPEDVEEALEDVKVDSGIAGKPEKEKELMEAEEQAIKEVGLTGEKAKIFHEVLRRGLVSEADKTDAEFLKKVAEFIKYSEDNPLDAGEKTVVRLFKVDSDKVCVVMGDNEPIYGLAVLDRRGIDHIWEGHKKDISAVLGISSKNEFESSIETLLKRSPDKISKNPVSSVGGYRLDYLIKKTDTKRYYLRIVIDKNGRIKTSFPYTEKIKK